MNTTKQPTPITGSGINWATGKILEHFQTVAPKPKKPKAEKADPQVDEPPRCYTCRGDEIEHTCQTCGNVGTLDPKEIPSVYMTVYRDFDEVEVQASIVDGKVIDAWVTSTVGEPGRMPRWAAGWDITLSLEEQDEAVEALKR